MRFSQRSFLKEGNVAIFFIFDRLEGVESRGLSTLSLSFLFHPTE